MTRELRQNLLAAQSELGGPPSELGPALSGGPVAGRRVDEEEDASANLR